MEDSDIEDDSPPTLGGFVEENYRLFTVIGVFAGLSVYLTELSSKQGPAARWGVSSSMLLFLLASGIGIIRTYGALGECREDASSNALMRAFPFSIVLYALFAMSGSIVYIMNNKYPDESGQLIISGVVYSAIFVYYILLRTRILYEEFRSYSWVADYYSYSPTLAIPIEALWIWHRVQIGAMQNPLNANVTKNLGHVIGMIAQHLALTLGILALLIGLDYLIEQNDLRVTVGSDT